MKFVHAVHLLDVDGVQVTTGVTQSGEVRLLTASGNTDVARLTPELAERLAVILHGCAERARQPAHSDADLDWLADRQGADDYYREEGE